MFNTLFKVSMAATTFGGEQAWNSILVSNRIWSFRLVPPPKEGNKNEWRPHIYSVCRCLRLYSVFKL